MKAADAINETCKIFDCVDQLYGFWGLFSQFSSVEFWVISISPVSISGAPVEGDAPSASLCRFVGCEVPTVTIVPRLSSQVRVWDSDAIQELLIGQVFQSICLGGVVL